MEDISKMNVPELENLLIRCAGSAEKKGLVWADKKALSDSMEDKRKVILADAAPLEGTEAGKERESLKSESYKTFLSGLQVARGEANRAYVEYSSAKDKFEAIRSILSNRREEMKRGL